ncbi:MAG: LysR family transcriptional regulator [Raoultibacter sp.]
MDVDLGERAIMDSKIFKYFIALEENHNFSRAAQSLYLSPQGLNSAIRRLEGEIGFPLFDVQNGSVLLTDYGKVFSTYAHFFDDALEKMRSELNALADHKANNIHIGCATGVLGYFGEENLLDFNRVSKNARIVLIEEVPDYLCEQHLVEMKYDFALIPNPLVSPVLAGISLCEDYQFVWVNKKNKLAQKKELDLADLANEKVITMDQSYKNTFALQQLSEERGVDLQLNYSGEMMRIYEFARRNEGVGITCRNHGANMESAVVACLPLRCLPWGFSLCYHQSRLLSAADLEFLDYMRTFRRIYD